MGSDLGIEATNWLAAPRKGRRNRSKSVSRELIERKHCYGSYERIDETLESSGSFKHVTGH